MDEWIPKKLFCPHCGKECENKEDNSIAPDPDIVYIS
jgi:hypothetical protein|tara:strand:+ start:383 stop:493 length:111 start_codon:yes stop_codon:yes gene_type:complete